MRVDHAVAVQIPDDPEFAPAFVQLVEHPALVAVEGQTQPFEIGLANSAIAFLSRAGCEPLGLR